MDPSIDLSAYLRRIGFTAAPRPDHATLRGIVAHHVAAIPFENLDPLTGVVVRLDLPSIERKLVGGGRGGYCFEQNALLAAALEQIGFAVTRLAARVLWGRADDAITARSHMLLRVDLDDGPVIVDVGFGGLTLTGTLALRADVEQPTPHEPFRLVAEPGGAWRMQARVNDQWKSLYRFDLQRQHAVDYEAPNWYLSTHPESHFVTSLVAARAAPDRRHALRNRELAVHPLRGETERRVIGTLDELVDVLQRDFRIALPAPAAWRARLQHLFED